MTDQSKQSPAITAAIYAGCIIAFISFGFAATFGVFMRPVSEALGWPRGIFSLSMAIQAISWGVTQPLAGMVADRFGSGKVLVFGALFAALGFAIRGFTVDPAVFIWSGVVVGIGTGAAAFQIVIIALGKVVAPAKRSFILGLGTASASAGMLLAAPMSVFLLGQIGWQNAIFVIAVSYLFIIPMAFFVNRVSVPTVKAGQSRFGYAFKSAFPDRAYLLWFTGFFVCGFHVAFIGTHLPAYIADAGLSASLGAWSLALIGLFNIAGSFLSGWSGQRYSKKRVLSGIYFTRAIVIGLFLLAPLTPGSIYAFSAAMGLLWLSTVPLTTALVAQTQGVAYLSTLGGLIFLSHQSGAFIGTWLGGRIFDAYGTYEPMWWAAIALGLVATLMHLPIRETAGPLAKATG
jgi:predicted MFS family arabinose efflux permease